MNFTPIFLIALAMNIDLYTTSTYPNAPVLYQNLPESVIVPPFLLPIFVCESLSLIHFCNLYQTQSQPGVTLVECGPPVQALLHHRHSCHPVF